MSNVAVLGLGAMGSRMAANLIRAGHTLTVWNRSAALAEPLAAAGARVATSPREAAAGADYVISMVRDDDASRYVWCDASTGALMGMNPGSVAIESATVTPGWVKELGGAANQANVDFLEAPVSGSRPAAAAGQLVYLVGGAAATFERCLPLLKAMGAAAHHVGPVGYGALAKLVTNTLLGIHVAALAEIIGMLRGQLADLPKILHAVAGTPAWAPVDTYLSGNMLAGDFSPQFPIDLIVKDFGYTLAVAGGAERVPMASSALGIFQQAIAAGLGGSNMTAVAELFKCG